MSLAAVLLPLFVEVALTLGLLFWLGPKRVGLIRAGAVRMKDVALGQKAWPDQALQIGNAYENQFQLPVLFYVLTILAVIAQKAGIVFVVLAWAFVITRLAHAYVHTTSNDMRMRFHIFAAGAVILSLNWILLALQVLLGL
jgi:hypothetical protein